MRNLVKLLASFFYLGYLPLISGTCATCAALGLYFLAKDNFSLYTILLITITGLGFLVSGRAEIIFQQKDSPIIVIDEAAGLLLAFWGLQLDLALIIVGFLLFRILDAAKVYPANQIEKLNGSSGVMGDDLVAGLYTNIVLQIVRRLT